MQVDGRDVAVDGVLTWNPPPSPWTVWPAYVAIALVALAAGLLLPGPRPLGWLLLVGGGAALWHAAATPEPASSLGSHAGASRRRSYPRSPPRPSRWWGGWPPGAAAGS